MWQSRRQTSEEEQRVRLSRVSFEYAKRCGPETLHDRSEGLGRLHSVVRPLSTEENNMPGRKGKILHFKRYARRTWVVCAKRFH